jgi:MarR family transcriptional regulator for hemolysin
MYTVAVTATDADARALLRAYLDAVALSEGVQSRLWKAAQLTLGQVRALRRLNDAPKSLGDLGGELSLSPTSMTRLIDRLEERGLVERRRDESNRRRVEAVLRPEGRDLIAGLPVLGGTAIWEAAHMLSAAESRRIATAFREFVDSVRKVEEIALEAPLGVSR